MLPPSQSHLEHSFLLRKAVSMQFGCHKLPSDLTIECFKQLRASSIETHL